MDLQMIDVYFITNAQLASQMPAVHHLTCPEINPNIVLVLYSKSFSDSHSLEEISQMLFPEFEAHCVLNPRISPSLSLLSFQY